MGAITTVLSKIPVRYWVILGVVLIITALGYTTKRLYDQKKVLELNQTQLNLKLEAKSVEYNRYKEGVVTNLQVSRERYSALSSQLTDVKVQNDKLSQKLSKHDLETLMWNHPVMVRNRINAATRDLLHSYKTFGDK